MEAEQVSLTQPDPFACLSGACILVVESNLDNQQILRYLFEEYDANLTFTHTTAETLAAIKQLQPELLISEILLSYEDGCSLIREVNAVQSKHSITIPSIALTVCARPEDRLRALSAGFCEYLSKPFSIERLLRLAADLIVSSRLD